MFSKFFPYKFYFKKTRVSRETLALFTDYGIWVKVTQNVAQYPLHHVTYAPINFEVAMSNGLGDALKRKYII